MLSPTWRPLILLVAVASAGTGAEGLERARAQRPDLLSLPGPRGFFTPGMWIGMTITLSFGIVFQPAKRAHSAT